MLFGSKSTLVTADEALKGRDTPLFSVPATHAVLGTPLRGPWPEGTQVLYLAMGCFWGVERIFWQLPGNPPTRRTRRPAPVEPATPRRCWSPTTRRSPRPRRC